jgi:Probable cobalt transporter subunit (CbtB)
MAATDVDRGVFRRREGPRARRKSFILRRAAVSTVTFDTFALPTPIPVRELVPWAVFGGLLLLLAIYFIGAEQGATSLVRGMYVHEFVHDGRHLLGFPCH